ncbi:helix-turn-helix domain-containing protein [Catenovulum sediminis]|uniref:helix-turn-helix domain-containing protein n=1 Tax=Catenovulum sediminis TaxID=1740262 RepID=UPI00117EFDB1|nr:helix-turn-helix domain-containing protein [Catenovulum sediminis]
MNKPAELTREPSTQAVKTQLARITQSKGFERSKINCKLLNFLVNYHLDSVESGQVARAPKEIEIAIGALGKAEDFNPAEDSSIRVYISNLRKKLESYYQTSGSDELFQMNIPTGGYALEFCWSDQQPLVENKPSERVDDKQTNENFKRWWVWALVASVIINVWFVLGTFTNSPTENLDSKIQIKQHDIWQPLFASDKPTLIVIGDLYMLTEVDPETNILRAIREFSINSDAQLEAFLQRFPTKRNKLNKASSAFLLKNSVFALQHLLPLLADDSTTAIRLVSELTPSDLRDFNLVYLGLYKSLGLLDAYLQGTNFKLLEGVSALHNADSGKLYEVKGDLEQEYTDYGSFAKFQGPSGNLFYIFAGFSDASVIQIAKYLSSPNKLFSAEIERHSHVYSNAKANYELIFAAASFDRTDLDSKLVDSGLLNIKAIWAMPDE